MGDPDMDYPFEVKTLQRGETRAQYEGWTNTLIVRVNRKSGQTWILTHVGKELVWVLVPEPT